MASGRDSGAARPGPLGVAAIVAVYTVVFCVALPVALFAAGFAVDRSLGWDLPASWLGAIPAAWGGWLQLAGMHALWTRGKGWPITALPPPRMVAGGPYLVARHPIYLGFNVLIFGLGLVVGSAGLAFVVAPLFAPVWIAYAMVEERGLLRRFGRDYMRYRERVGLLPRPSVRWLMVVLKALGVLRVRVEGARHVPADGPAILAGNHSCYVDPVWLALASPRLVWMAATAEAYRSPGWIGGLTRMWPAFPLRRYRTDPEAARQMVALLAGGEVVGMFNERERSVLGRYLGTEPEVAGILPKLGVPVIPVGIEGAYATGPRWAGGMRFPRITIRFGPPVDWSVGSPAEALDRAILSLLDEDPQRVWLERHPLDRLGRAVWRCPACLDEAGWRPEELRCAACGSRWEPSGDGRIRGPEGVRSFADWAEPVWQATDPALEVPVRVFAERSVFGPVEPVEDRGEAVLRIASDGLSWDDRHIPLDAIRSTSTERADTLQVGTGDAMWQFRTEATSPFRMRIALDRHRGIETPGVRAVSLPRQPRAEAPAPARTPEAAAVGLGLAAMEGLTLLIPLSEGHGAAGLAAGALPMWAAYVGLGGLIDLGAARLGLPRGAAGAAMALGLLGVALGTGQVLFPALLVLGLSALWAVAAHLEGWRAVAAVVAIWGLSPVLPRPAPGLSELADRGVGPSMVVVLLDTARADRTSLERTDRDTTPNLAALAAEGVRFDRAYSTSCWSLPSQASLLTGLYPERHGAHYEHLSLDTGVPVLAEALRRRGYETAGFSANPLIAPGTGLARGFTRFEESWRTVMVRESLLGWRAWHRLAAPSRDKAGGEVLAELRRWHRSRDDARPYFVFVNLMEAHAPYQEVPAASRDRWRDPALSPSELEAIGERAHMSQVFGTSVPEADHAVVLDLADGALHAVDRLLGEIRAELDDAAVWVVLSDHGELFGEHEGLWGHNLGLYEPLVRVPFVIAAPGARAGRSIAEPVSLVDVAPTLASFAGAPYPVTDGIDLGPALGGALLPSDRPVHASHQRTDFLTEGWQLMDPLGDHDRIRGRRATVVQGSLKRVITEAGEDRGYDLDRDPAESEPFPGARTGLEVALPGPGSGGGLIDDPATLEALRELGYVR